MNTVIAIALIVLTIIVIILLVLLIIVSEFSNVQQLKIDELNRENSNLRSTIKNLSE
jgi:predicted PurR-regulated permease PerM